MPSDNPFADFSFGEVFEGVLPDFVLSFAFFTAGSYAVLGRRLGQQRPAVVMSATLGMALSIGLVWWEQRYGWSVRDLGPVALVFVICVLGIVMFQATRQIGGWWGGAGISLAGALLAAWLLGVHLPVDPQFSRTVLAIALIVAIIALLSHRRARDVFARAAKARLANVRHDMRDLYDDRRTADRLTQRFRGLREESRWIHEHPQLGEDIKLQLRRMLPAQGWLTDRMARLRERAHRVREGHVAKIQETQSLLTKLPAAAKKSVSQELSRRYGELQLDTRIERLDRAVAENERRIKSLTEQADRCLERREYQELWKLLNAAEKLQHHNSQLLRIIERTESRLLAISKEAVRQASEVHHA